MTTASSSDDRNGGPPGAPPGDAAEDVTAARSRRRRARSYLGAVYLVAVAFYYWTTTSTGFAWNFGGRQTDPYNELTDGFLHGELSVPTLPPKGLLALPDPYAPLENRPFNAPIHDLALYHGHLYLTWGPTPVVTLFLPWRLLHVGAIPQGFALFLYCIAALGCSLLLLEFLVARYLPRTRAWQLGLGGVALATGNVAPFLLRSPYVYEVNIASSLCFAIAGLLLFATGGLGDFRPWRVAGGSLCLGLAAGGREDDVILGLLAFGLVVLVARRTKVRDWRGHARLAIPALAPFAAIAVLLLAYNVARFGSPLQFGEQYQLAGIDVQTTPFYQVGYLAPSLFYYLVDPIKWSLAFPYFVLPPPAPYPFGVPSAYAPDVMGGILAATPILLGLVAFPRVVRRRRMPPELAWSIGALLAVAVAIVLAISLSIPGGSMRYEADFATLAIIPALVMWYALTDVPRGGGRGVRIALGVVAIGYGFLVGVAISMTGYFTVDQKVYPDLEASDPGVYWALDRLTSVVPTAVTMLIGRPMLTKIASPHGVGATKELSSLGAGTAISFFVSGPPTNIEVVAPRDSQKYLTGTFGRARQGPPLSGIVLDELAAGHLRSFPVRLGKMALPVPLHTGLNRIELWIYAAPHVRRQARYLIVRVSGFELSAGPPHRAASPRALGPMALH